MSQMILGSLLTASIILIACMCLYMGYRYGCKKGNEIGYQKGYVDGQDTGYHKGNIEGHEIGQDTGYKTGYQAGYAEAETKYKQPELTIEQKEIKRKREQFENQFDRMFSFKLNRAKEKR